MTTDQPDRTNRPPKGYWACACVRRDKAGRMTHVKFNPPTLKRCRVCKCEPLPGAVRRDGVAENGKDGRP